LWWFSCGGQQIVLVVVDYFLLLFNNAQELAVIGVNVWQFQHFWFLWSVVSDQADEIRF